jgi:hypothetical protein
MENAMARPVTLVSCIVILLATAAGRSDAIPSFARKFKMSCSGCHAPFPSLKPAGREFAASGFQLSEKDPPGSIVDAGDDQLSLMSELPLSLRLEGYARWQPQDAGRSDLEAPYLLKLISGGQIAPDISYYFYFFFGERGEVAGLEDAFIMFNNLFRSNLDLTVGQFQVSDPLFKRELRLTLEDYQVYETRPGRSAAGLTYDRGLMLSYGFPTGTDITLEVLNGSGIGEMDATRSFDTDRYKNFALHVSQELFDGVRVGGFGYYGKEESQGVVNTLWMAGPDLTLSAEQLQLNVQYMERRDDDPDFVYAVRKTKTRGAMAELRFSPGGDQSDWYGAALYNWVEIGPGLYRYHTVTGHASYMLARNFRLLGEYTFDLERMANRLSVGFVSAF